MDQERRCCPQAGELSCAPRAAQGPVPTSIHLSEHRLSLIPVCSSKYFTTLSMDECVQPAKTLHPLPPIKKIIMCMNTAVSLLKKHFMSTGTAEFFKNVKNTPECLSKGISQCDSRVDLTPTPVPVCSAMLRSQILQL